MKPRKSFHQITVTIVTFHYLSQFFSIDYGQGTQVTFFRKVDVPFYFSGSCPFSVEALERAEETVSYGPARLNLRYFLLTKGTRILVETVLFAFESDSPCSGSWIDTFRTLLRKTACPGCPTDLERSNFSCGRFRRRTINQFEGIRRMVAGNDGDRYIVSQGPDCL